MIVALEGLPGAGKTTTAKLAAEALGGEYVHERSADHPFLEDFYRDTERYTLETELCFCSSTTTSTVTSTATES